MKEPIGKKLQHQYDRFMSLEELKLILGYLKKQRDPKFYLLFLTQATLALRISEALTIQWQDILFSEKTTTIKVRLAKTDKVKIKTVPQRLAQLLWAYIQQYKFEIRGREGYLFYSFDYRCKRPHISKARAWQRLREAVDAVGINDSYGGAYRIGTHSLRRLGITTLLQESNDLFFVQHFVGHTDAKQTQKYLNYSEFMEQENKVIDAVFERLEEPKVTVTDRSLVEKMVREKVQEVFGEMFQKIAKAT